VGSAPVVPRGEGGAKLTAPVVSSPVAASSPVSVPASGKQSNGAVLAGGVAPVMAAGVAKQSGRQNGNILTEAEVRAAQVQRVGAQTAEITKSGAVKESESAPLNRAENVGAVAPAQAVRTAQAGTTNSDIGDYHAIVAVPVIGANGLVVEYRPDILRSDDLVRELEANGIIRMRGTDAYSLIDTVRYQTTVQNYVAQNGAVQTENLLPGTNTVFIGDGSVVTLYNRDISNIKTVEIAPGGAELVGAEKTEQVVFGGAVWHLASQGNDTGNVLESVKVKTLAQAESPTLADGLNPRGEDGAFDLAPHGIAGTSSVVTENVRQSETAHTLTQEQVLSLDGEIAGTTAPPRIVRGEVNGTSGIFAYRSMTNDELLIRAYNLRVDQAAFIHSATLSGVANSLKYETKASFLEAVAKYRKKGISVGKSAANTIGRGGRTLVAMSTYTLSSRGDLGDDVAAGILTSATLGYEGWRLAQTASSIVINGVSQTGKNIVKTAQNVADVAQTVEKAAQSVAGTVSFARKAFIPFNSQITRNVFKNYARDTGLLQTATTQRLMQTAKNLKAKADKVKAVTHKTVSGAVKVGKGAADVAQTAYRFTVTVKRTMLAPNNFIGFRGRFTKESFLKYARETRLLNTITARKIAETAKKVKATATHLAHSARVAATTTIHAAVSSYNVVRGLIRGNVTFSAVSTAAIQRLAQMGYAVKMKALRGMKTALPHIGRGVNVVGRTTLRGAVKTGVWARYRGLPGAVKTIDKGVISVGGVLMTSDDMMLRGVGGAMTLTDYGVKTASIVGRVGFSTAKTTVKAGVKTGTTLAHTVQYARAHGFRATWQHASRKISAAMKEAGKSAVTALINLLKGAGTKIVVPIILIAAVLAGTMGLFSAPAAAIGTIFSGLFDKINEVDGTRQETDIRVFISDPTESGAIPALRTDYINDLHGYIQDNYKSDGGSYDIVRFKTNQDDEVLDASVSGISSVFYTVEELTNIIQPIYNAVLLMDYELEPTEAEAYSALNDVFQSLFRITETTGVEYCGQDITDGTGTANEVHSQCSRIHALSDCPNFVTGTHSSYTCSSCCDRWWTCDGHRTLDCRSSHHSSSCYTTDENGRRVLNCSTRHGHRSSCYSYPKCSDGRMSSSCSNSTYHHSCDGYKYCDSHAVLVVTLNMDGIYQLLAKYFTDPIDVLLNRQSAGTLTEAEAVELTNLQDNYELCLEMITQVNQLYGGGMSLEDISGVIWVNGSRVGCQDIVDHALSQVGNVGGQPYWSYYGFSNRVAWCACFVHWVMNTGGYGDEYAQSANNAYCPTLNAWFVNAGRWADSSFRDIVPGDTIFFDWEGDGRANHIGIVIGRDDTYVYTVEGNSGDAVKVKQYSLTSSVIKGYGLMNY